MMSRYARYKNDQRTKQEVVEMMNGTKLTGKSENDKKISRKDKCNLNKQKIKDLYGVELEQVGGAEYIKITVKLETGLGENTAYDNMQNPVNSQTNFFTNNVPLDYARIWVTTKRVLVLLYL